MTNANILFQAKTIKDFMDENADRRMKNRYMDAQIKAMDQKQEQAAFNLGDMAEKSAYAISLGQDPGPEGIAAIKAYSALKQGTKTYTDELGRPVTVSQPTLADVLGIGADAKPVVRENLPQGTVGDLAGLQDMTTADMVSQIGGKDVGASPMNMGADSPGMKMAGSVTPAMPEKLKSMLTKQQDVSDLDPEVANSPYGRKVMFAKQLEMKADKTKKAQEFSDTQGKAALYADRMIESDAVMAPLTKEQINLQNRLREKLPVVGNYLVTPDYQKASQAERNFINAVLRRESGAVISPQEFANARQQYFPQPGDTEEVVAQKAQNRKTAIDGFARESGPAYTPKKIENPIRAQLKALGMTDAEIDAELAK